MGLRLLGTDKEEAFQFTRSYTSSNLNNGPPSEAENTPVVSKVSTSNILDQRHHETCGYT